MSNAPVICFGQQPCGFFPKRFLVAKFLTARRLQSEIGGEIVFFYHDSDHDPRETQTTLRHRKTNEPAILNFAFANKVQRKFSPLYLKHIAPGWQAKTELQLPNYVERPSIELFKKAAAGLAHLDTTPAPSPRPSGERAGERGFEPEIIVPPHPGPLLHFMEEREKAGAVSRCAAADTIADFCLEMYRLMGLLDGIRVVRSSDPAFRRAACEVPEYFVDVPYEGETVRARFYEGTPVSESASFQGGDQRADSEIGVPKALKLHEGGNSFITLPLTTYTKEQISPTRDTRLRWMQSVLHCTHYIAGAGEQAYLRREDAPEITFIQRDTIDRSDEAYTEIPQ